MGWEDAAEINEKIENMIELHQDGEIFIPNFRPGNKLYKLEWKSDCKKKNEKIEKFIQTESTDKYVPLELYSPIVTVF